MTDLELKLRERMTDEKIKLREKLLELRANVNKIPYEEIPEINYSGDKWHESDDFYERATKRMVVHMFRLISEKNYEGIKDMYSALNKKTQYVMRWHGEPIEKNTDEYYNSTYKLLDHGYLDTAKYINFWDKEQIISVLKKKYSIVGNVTTPAEFAASLLMNESTKSLDDIIDLWNILFYLSSDEITKTDYMQDFIRKAENIKSFDDGAKEAAKRYKKKYFKERKTEKFSSMKGKVGSFFGKKTEAPAPAPAPATQAVEPAAPTQASAVEPEATAARAPEPVAATAARAPKPKPKPVATAAARKPVATAAARKPVAGWRGGVRRKSRKQNKSRKQGKTKKQRKNKK